MRLAMDAVELVEENLFAVSDAKLHGGMCRQLSAILYEVLAIFPVMEAARPRSKSGIQALCSLHVTLDKSKSLLQHCSECSKLYLAITGYSILMKFEKARCALQESLTNVQGIVPQAIGCQIMKIVGELERTVFVLDHIEKKAGDEVISLLQERNNSDSNSNDGVELEVFHQAVLKLGITSSIAALSESRALNKLIERARAEEDKRKESNVAYLLHLTRKYSRLFRNDIPDDSDSQGSNPCSPTIPCSCDESNNDFRRQLSKQASFISKPHNKRSEELSAPPEEFRCSISLQIMHEPVVISSGQTYERLCIEKWFKDGHETCPKTQQKLTHFSLTPNFCVKGLIASWCQQNGFPVPGGPPVSLNLNSWSLSLPVHKVGDSRSMESLKSCGEAAKGSPQEKNGGITEEHIQNDHCNTNSGDTTGSEYEFERYKSLFEKLRDSTSRTKQLKAIQEIRFLLKDDGEARIYMGADGFVKALVQFLKSASDDGDKKAQEVGALALFNLAVNNDRNKDKILSAGVIPLLEKMVSNPMTCESATALYLNLSCLEKAKPIIASSQAVSILVQLLSPESPHSISCKHDALFCLFNLSSHAPTVNHLIHGSIIDSLHFLVSNAGTPTGSTLSEKALAILSTIASNKSAMSEIISTPGLIASIATALNIGQIPVQEQAISFLLILCAGNERSCQTVLREGVIPALVSVSANGTQRGKEKAQKLLKLFREQRQRESSLSRECVDDRGFGVTTESRWEPKPSAKSRSARIARTVSSFWKPKRR